MVPMGVSIAAAATLGCDAINTLTLSILLCHAK